MRVVKYFRVSTKMQEASGLGIEAQQFAVDTYLKRFQHEVIGDYLEIASGTLRADDRPKLKEAINLCRLTNSTLVFARLDRLYRNINALSELLESGIEYICVDNPDCGKFVLQILGCVSEKEAKDIAYRVKVALAEAKKRGTILGSKGRFNLKPEDRAKGRLEATKKIKQNSLAFAERLRPILQDCSQRQLTLVETADYLESLQVKSARGKSKWYASSVRNLKDTLGI